jgi:hypothetical protein
MPTNSKQSIKEIVFITLGTSIICGSAVFGFSFLWKERSQPIANPVIHPSSWQWMTGQTPASREYNERINGDRRSNIENKDR